MARSDDKLGRLKCLVSLSLRLQLSVPIQREPHPIGFQEQNLDTSACDEAY